MVKGTLHPGIERFLVTEVCVWVGGSLTSLSLQQEEDEPLVMWPVTGASLSGGGEWNPKCERVRVCEAASAP